MLTPEYLQGVPDAMVQLYAQAELDILADMARRISGFDLFIPSAQYQMQMLEEMGALRADILAELGRLTKKSQKELLSIMKEAGVETLDADDVAYKAAGLSSSSTTVSPAVRATLEAGLKKTNGLFENLSKTTANTATKQFERALDRAYMQVTSGAIDPASAVKGAIKGLAKQGVGSIEYPSGHVDSIEVAVRRATITGVNQTCLKVQEVRADDLGVDLVETTAHAGARPSHAAWQGQIFSRSGKSTKYPDFVQITGYGSGAGLGGWNCSHSFRPYIEGMPRTYSKELLKDYEAKDYEYNGQKMTEYEALQEQRSIERSIRRWKREYKAMDAANLPTDEAAVKITKWQGTQKDFLEQTGLKRQGERESVVGFGKSEASKASWGARKINNPVDFPKDTFSRNTKTNNINDQNYADALTKRFNAGSKTAQKAFAKYVPDGSVVDGAFSGTAHYSPSTKHISMDCASDAQNVRGAGATYFHEHGHLVDFASGTPVSRSEAFKSALQNDFEEYIISHMAHNAVGYKAACSAISADLRKSDLYSAVSDIMGGLSDGVVQGGWGHRAAYWARDAHNITAESFAHLFEAQFSTERLKIFKEYFPTAADEFDKILEGLI